jgi:SPP1 gp7 family putative phage head morphogenesis protein
MIYRTIVIDNELVHLVLDNNKEQLQQKETTINAFAVLSVSEATRRFREWLKSRMEDLVIEEVGVRDENGSWVDGYVETAYFKGAEQAEQKVPPKYPATGHIPLDEVLRPGSGTRIRSFLRGPVNLDKVRLLKERVYEQMEGITNHSSTALGNILSDGIVKGDSPRKVARDIAKSIDSISRTRALVIARTETIRAHAEGSLDALEQLGVTEVGVDVEFQATMIDEDAGIFEEKVCPQCQELFGEVFSIEEAHGIIPVHPNCRCAWVPYI